MVCETYLFWIVSEYTLASGWVYSDHGHLLSYLAFIFASQHPKENHCGLGGNGFITDFKVKIWPTMFVRVLIKSIVVVRLKVLCSMHELWSFS